MKFLPAISRPLSLSVVLVALLIQLPSSASAALIVVTNTNGGQIPGSLAAAILIANSHPAHDTIIFNIPTSDPNYHTDPSGAFWWTITLQSGLPSIDTPVTIDGPSAGISPTGNPTIVLDGNNLPGTTTDGLRLINSQIYRIEGLSIVNFPEHGIEVTIHQDLEVSGSWIGVAPPFGDVAQPNGGDGINIIAGASISLFGENVISGNRGDGVYVGTNNTAGFFANNNYIGTNAAGDADVGNGENGITIVQPINSRIGSRGSNTGNVVSGNGGNGIYVYFAANESGADNLNIVANLIGTNAIGTAAIPNDGHGIELEKCHKVYVGMDLSAIDPGERNLISGNSGHGIYLHDTPALDDPDLLINGNYIGTNLAGDASIGNGQSGVYAFEFPPTLNLNIISGNADAGVYLDHADSRGILAPIDILDNRIGTSAAGGVALPNGSGAGSNGITLFNTGHFSIKRNVVSGNIGAGIFLSGGTTDNGEIEFNLIGVDNLGSGVIPLGNTTAGIGASLAANTVGLFRNTIAYNGTSGISLSQAFAPIKIGFSGSIPDLIYANGTEGITLAGSGPNDPGDPDSGPNRFQNYPDLDSANYNALTGQLDITYTIDTNPTNATYNLSAFFFLADATGQGKAHLGTDFINFTPGDFGTNVTTTYFPTATPLQPGDQIVAVATDALWNMSEFSPPLTINVSGGMTTNLTAFLEGPYTSDPFSGSGSMSTALIMNGLLPNFQPYNTSPWNYAGDEAVDFIPNPDITDWVLVSARSGTGAETTLATRAGFIKKDGTIVGHNGAGPVFFPTLMGGNYYFVVDQRNHLSIMTPGPLNCTSGSCSHDFTTGQNKAFGINPMRDLGDGSFGMLGGDGDGNSSVSAFDFLNTWLPINGSSNLYAGGDFNLDTEGTAFDFLTVWLPANGQVSQVP